MTEVHLRDWLGDSRLSRPPLVDGRGGRLSRGEPIQRGPAVTRGGHVPGYRHSEWGVPAAVTPDVTPSFSSLGVSPP